MGLPLGPTFANVFMSYHENNWLDNCSDEIKPIFYKRYMDDCFLIFRKKDQAIPFLNYLNAQHPNINFTMECEHNNIISFLDVRLERIDCGVETGVFRKPTFTGLGMSFFSFTPKSYKLSLIKTLIYRAYHISSTYKKFHEEIIFLKKYLFENGYPEDIFLSNFK